MEKYKAVVQKSLAYFGTYSIDEITKLITYKVEASRFPKTGQLKSGASLSSTPMSLSTATPARRLAAS